MSCHILKRVGKAILFCVVGGPPLAMLLKSPEILPGSEAEQPAKSVTEPHLSLNDAAYTVKQSKCQVKCGYVKQPSKITYHCLEQTLQVLNSVGFAVCTDRALGGIFQVEN